MSSPFIKITYFSLTFTGTTGGSTPCICADDFRHYVTRLKILVENSAQGKPAGFCLTTAVCLT